MDPVYNKWLRLLTSRKFLALVVGIAMAIFGERAGISFETILAAVVTIVGYILGTALEDGLSRR